MLDLFFPWVFPVPSHGNAQGHAHDRIPGYTADETKGIFSEMLRLLSTPMRIGSHYEGTSTNDVTFWVLHPTMDRYAHESRRCNLELLFLFQTRVHATVAGFYILLDSCAHSVYFRLFKKASLGLGTASVVGMARL